MLEQYKNKIICGEAIETMKLLPDKSIDMILTDPPYGTTSCKWDTIIPFDPLWEQYKRIIKDNGAIVLTASQPFTSALVMSNVKMFKYEWIWEKTQATGMLNANKQPLKSHENILVFYKRQPTYNPQKTHNHKPMNSGIKRKKVLNRSNIYGKVKNDLVFGGNTDRFPRTNITFKSDKQTNYFHPTQKPVALFEYLIRTYTSEQDVILDNCAGSFTTAVAADNTKRRWICIEKEKNYCDIGLKRINENRERLNYNLF